MNKFEKRTDLAIERKESFPEDQVEIAGVILKEEHDQEENIRITTVEITTNHGAKEMKKPKGLYITLEFTAEQYGLSEKKTAASEYLCMSLQKLVSEIEKKEKRNCTNFLLVGLGNRFATPDALGPYVLEKVSMNRHVYKEYLEENIVGQNIFCGIIPGVMCQTGMESSEILQGLAAQIKPDAFIVIDALATSSIGRLCNTIQITDTGISPGAGIGNNRNQINKDTMGIPVIAIGVPTVVDIGTIILETLEQAFSKEGYSEMEIAQFYRGIISEEMKNLFVTPKEIDEQIREIGDIIALALQKFQKKKGHILTQTS